MTETDCKIRLDWAISNVSENSIVPCMSNKVKTIVGYTDWCKKDITGG